ncbi:MAG: AMP-binding protein, partial [Acidisphaera sp.]|nr:AMP-binding protein [Acidisphaera sp.]
MSLYDAPHLARNAANYAALTPLNYLARAAAIYPDKVAVIDGARRFTYREFYARCRRFAGALRRRGIGKGDTVAVMAPNVPALLEAHYAVPMTGAVLNALNYRLDARSIAFILNHGGAKLLIADREFGPTVRDALAELGRDLPVVDIIDDAGAAPLSDIEYEAFLGEGDPNTPWSPPADEWDAIALNYTSGTTGNPKGVVYHHRGAFLNAMGNAITFGLDRHAVYLWTLPMFHCNGWTYTWGVTAVAGTHVCLRAVRADAIWRAIAEHGVTHLCGAPVVMSTILALPEAERPKLQGTVRFMTAAAPPPPSVLTAMQLAGFEITHLYGLTETYGPAVVNEWHAEWDALPAAEWAARQARQGVRYVPLEALAVMDPATMRPVAPDGATLGEVMFRGNVVMKGYLRDPAATEAAFASGWFHSGDLGVQHPDGYIELKDRSKDIIISGG